MAGLINEYVENVCIKGNLSSCPKPTLTHEPIVTNLDTLTMASIFRNVSERTCGILKVSKKVSLHKFKNMVTKLSHDLKEPFMNYENQVY